MDHCAEGGLGGNFQWLPFSTCFPTDDGSIAFQACGNGVYTAYVFTDTNCQDFNAGITQKLPVCQYNEDNDSGDEASIYNYQTFMCN